MKNILLLLLTIFITNLAYNQQQPNLRIHKTNGTIQDILLGDIESITFSIQPSLSDGLLAYFPFNGNANDESGNGHNGILHNVNSVADRFGNDGKAYSFLGNSSSYIQTDTSSAITFSGQSTLVAWVKGAGTLNNILRIIGTTDDGIEIGTYSDGTSNANFTYGSAIWQNVTSTTIINDNIWHFVVIVVNENEGKLFVDGVIVKDIIAGGSFLMTKPAYIAIGRHPIFTSRAFNGSIDDLRIYNRSLLESEIQLLYHEGGWNK